MSLQMANLNGVRKIKLAEKENSYANKGVGGCFWCFGILFLLAGVLTLIENFFAGLFTIIVFGVPPCWLASNLWSRVKVTWAVQVLLGEAWVLLSNFKAEEEARELEEAVNMGLSKLRTSV